MKLGINAKMIISTIIIMIIPSLFIGIYGYNAAQKSYLDGVNERLQDQASDWRLLIKAYNEEIELQQQRARTSAEDIVTAQAKATYDLIDKYVTENDGALSDSAKEELLITLNKNTVGKTGYIWILDYDGAYVLSKERQRDGENIWETKDSDGNLVIQDLINKGKGVQGSEIAYHSYPWLNIGETEPREKIAAMLHFPQMKWVVGISTYYDDLVDMDYKERTIEKAKDLIAKQVVGKSGYIWVVDSNGAYQVSKQRLRDGEDISQSKDDDGVLFIQEAIKKAKAAGDGTDIQIYPWKNQGESSARLKAAGLVYVPEWDWVVGVSAYYEDFQTGALGAKGILITLLISMIIGSLIVLVIANRISKPLRLMAKAGNEIAEGNLNVDIPEVNSGDEVEEIGDTMNLLTGALKYYKSEKK